MRRPASVEPATYLILAGILLATGATFWPGVGASGPLGSRTAKSVLWYSGHIGEARIMNRACLAAETHEAMPDEDDCRNALKALTIRHAAGMHASE
mgnify:CR=1 FL=1